MITNRRNILQFLGAAPFFPYLTITERKSKAEELADLVTETFRKGYEARNENIYGVQVYSDPCVIRQRKLGFYTFGENRVGSIVANSMDVELTDYLDIRKNIKEINDFYDKVESLIREKLPKDFFGDKEYFHGLEVKRLNIKRICKSSRYHICKLSYSNTNQMVLGVLEKEEMSEKEVLGKNSKLFSEKYKYVYILRHKDLVGYVWSEHKLEEVC
jgi:hypothetical protein